MTRDRIIQIFLVDQSLSPREVGEYCAHIAMLAEKKMQRSRVDVSFEVDYVQNTPGLPQEKKDQILQRLQDSVNDWTLYSRWQQEGMAKIILLCPPVVMKGAWESSVEIKERGVRKVGVLPVGWKSNHPDWILDLMENQK
jgi:hypothetical protein